MISKEDVIEVLKHVIDPELMIDVWTLGLIYKISIEGQKLHIEMTFTSMMCPAGPQLMEEVRASTMELDGINETEVEIVFDPPWEPSEELRAILGID